MSITISFGPWEDTRTYFSPDGSAGQLWRRGFAIGWARSLEPHVLFALKVRIRINGIEVEQGIMIRDFGAEA